jgi:AmmeMemoRadiSam system protein B
MCGSAPTLALITAALELGATDGEIIRYQTSGDVSGDYESVVGYAGIVIRR